MILLSVTTNLKISESFNKEMNITKLGIGLSLTCGALVAGRLGLEKLAQKQPELWLRKNHAGKEISLIEGPLTVIHLIGAVGARPQTKVSKKVDTFLILSAASVGLVDDLFEEKLAKGKGFKGHLKALTTGKLTTGDLKILGIGISALVVAWNSNKNRSGAKVRLAHTGLDAMIIALSANFVNLLDLRPGRALKFYLGSDLVLSAVRRDLASHLVQMPLYFQVLPVDLKGIEMLGDCGANALGANLGSKFADSGRTATKLGALGVLVGLTYLSEKVSFSKLISVNPVLRYIDEFGVAKVNENNNESAD